MDISFKLKTKLWNIWHWQDNYDSPLQWSTKLSTLLLFAAWIKAAAWLCYSFKFYIHFSSFGWNASHHFPPLQHEHAESHCQIQFSCQKHSAQLAIPISRFEIWGHELWINHETLFVKKQILQFRFMILHLVVEFEMRRTFIWTKTFELFLLR